MDILKRIDDLRKQRGWSINNLAMEAMLTQSTLNNLYSRGSEPKLSTLRAICSAFGISLAEFFSEDTASCKTENVHEALLQRVDALSPAQQSTLLAFLKTI